jgi:N-acetylmuramate 1-kinase
LTQVTSAGATGALNDGDLRLGALQRWLKALGRFTDFELRPASSDASFRRYFRVQHDSGTAIVMDAPPERENCEPFLKVAALMQAASLNVPQILAQDLEQGFLLLSDLGTQTYLQVINDYNADALFDDATTALLRWQAASHPDVLPAYDDALLRRELALFPDWYLSRHHHFELSAAQQEVLAQVSDLLVKRALAQAQVYVHRDYMPRNLMISSPNPGVLDFQDAVFGPIGYDVVSLFKDAFLSWPQARVREWARRYWERACHERLPVPTAFDDFYADFEWIGLQRHLKVMGIFARINYRDGKPGYLADTPRFFAYVRETTTRYPELLPLARLLDAIEAQASRQGTSL